MNEEGDWHPGCRKCKHLEDAGLPSMRQKINENLPGKNIQYMQISLSNHCNFSCKTCDSRSSSTIMKMVDANPELEKWFYKSDLIISTDFEKVFEDIDLSDLEVIEFLGGEPFVDPQTTNFLNYLLEHSNLSNVRFKVHTNTSFFPKKLVPILAQMKRIDLHLSVDSWHPSVEYSRLGSNFEVIKQVAKQWIDFSKKYKNTHIKLFPTVNVFNVQYLQQTKQAAEELGIDFGFEWVEHPKHLNINALPESYVKSIKDNYNEKFFKNYKFNQQQFDDLKDFLKDTDGAQGKFLKDYIPDLAKYFEGE
jgi:MoaA/NifB/PqqE/SkfB family radical SAM enzyme